MGARDRRERDKAAVREGILDAAIEIASAGRWEDVTIRAVSARIEYSLTIIYQHFDSKDGIRLGLLRRGFAQLSRELEAADRRDMKPVDRIATLARTYFEFGTANQALYQIMHGLSGVPFGAERAPPEAHASFLALREPFLAARADGSALDDIEHKVELCWAHLHGLVTLTLNDRIAQGAEHARALLGELARMHALNAAGLIKPTTRSPGKGAAKPVPDALSRGE